jgi:dethiobiotin synthetase
MPFRGISPGGASQNAEGQARPQRLVVVAGTGTEVGKTWVAAAVARELRERGVAVSARKPAQSFEPADVEPGGIGTDADALADATGEDPLVVCPPHRRYPVPMAPPMAADALGRDRISVATLAGEVACSWPEPAVDVGLVELAGGTRSPAAHDGDGVDLTRAVDPDLVVLVADAGLGTVHAVRAALDGLGPWRARTVVHLNRFEGTDLQRRNLDQLVADGGTVTTTVQALAAHLWPA